MDVTVSYLRAALLSWEKLRIAYNVILLVEGLIGLAFLRLLEKYSGHVCAALFGVWGMIIVFGIVANMLYCLGPAAEVCAAVIFGRRIRRARYLLFAAGLVFSMGLILALAMRGATHIGGYLK